MLRPERRQNHVGLYSSALGVFDRQARVTLFLRSAEADFGTADLWQRCLGRARLERGGGCDLSDGQTLSHHRVLTPKTPHPTLIRIPKLFHRLGSDRFGSLRPDW